MKVEQPSTMITLSKAPSLQSLEFLSAIKKMLPIAGILILVVFWIAWIDSFFVHWGLFPYIGADWGMFWAAAHTFRTNGPASVYDLHQLGEFSKPLGAFYGPDAGPLWVNPVPYPPFFMLLLWPFSFFSPVTGLFVWGATNALAAGYVVVSLARRFNLSVWLTVPTLFMTLPLGVGLVVGQPVGLLMLGFYMLYVNLERGEDLKAGLWGGLLLLKPQYAIVLGLVFLLKQRWSVLGGLTIAGALIAFSTLAVLGPTDTLAFIHSITGYADGFRDMPFQMSPQKMISWRGVLVALFPNLTELAGLIATLFLSALTLVGIPIIWRGSWNPRHERFSIQMLATMIITMMVGFDVHIHGAVLLIIPAIAVFCQHHRRSLRVLLITGSFFEVPLAIILTLLSGRSLMVTTGLVFAALQCITLAVIVVPELRRAQRPNANRDIRPVMS